MDISAGITGAYLDISGKASFPTLLWLLLLGLGLIIAPFIAFHNLRLKRDELNSKLIE